MNNHPTIRSSSDNYNGFNNFPSTKKEDNEDHENDHHVRPNPNSSSRHWSTYKNPRIVRVSRAFGGKDRHSKVCTIRGLRDRRIRLSVPTAIQLYDLQDRLGLSQPSKVVDWLLDATKDDIEKLPSLPIFPIPHHQDHEPSNFTTTVDHHHHHHDDQVGGLIGPGFIAQNLFPHNFGFNSYQHNFNWEPPNLSLSQSGMYTVPNVVDTAGPEMYFYPAFASMMPSANLMESDQMRELNTTAAAATPLLPTTLNLISPGVNKPFGSKSSVYNTLLESDQTRRFLNK